MTLVADFYENNAFLFFDTKVHISSNWLRVL